MTDLMRSFDDSEDNNLKATQEDLDMAARGLNFSNSSPKLIDAEDEFEFECQQCGACCINRSDIILNPFDIYTAAKYLGISCPDFLTKYTSRSLGGNSKIPMVTLKPNSKDGFCPFLEFDYLHDAKFKCAINSVKPGACRSHPIGLISKCDLNDDGTMKSFSTSFIKVDQCDQSKTGKMQKVKDWMQYYTDNEKSIIKAHKLAIMTNSTIDWRQVFFMVSVFAIASENKKIPHDNEMMTQGFNMFANIMVSYTYAKYDTDKPFDEQCDENYEALRTKFIELKDTVISAMKAVFFGSCGMTLETAIKIADKEGYEKTILDLGMNHCKYPGCNVPSVEEKMKERRNHDGDSN